MLITVKHVSSKDSWVKPKDGSSSWVEYWYKHSKYEYPSICPDCKRHINSVSELVGAHVKKVNSYDDTIYIVPVCRECNSEAATNNHQFVCNSELLVPSNKYRL